MNVPLDQAALPSPRGKQKVRFGVSESHLAQRRCSQLNIVLAASIFYHSRSRLTSVEHLGIVLRPLYRVLL